MIERDRLRELLSNALHVAAFNTVNRFLSDQERRQVMVPKVCAALRADVPLAEQIDRIADDLHAELVARHQAAVQVPGSLSKYVEARAR